MVWLGHLGPRPTIVLETLPVSRTMSVLGIPFGAVPSGGLRPFGVDRSSSARLPKALQQLRQGQVNVRVPRDPWVQAVSNSICIASKCFNSVSPGFLSSGLLHKEHPYEGAKANT